MLLQTSAARAIRFILLIIALQGCKEDRNNGGTDGDAIPFDTARAAGSVIPLSEAIRLQQSFISTRTELSKLINDTGYLSRNFNLPNGEAFSKDAILLLLSQKEADGIRLYYGKDSKGVVRLVLLPVRKDGSVIYNKLIATVRPGSDSSLNKPSVAEDGNAEAVETGQTCPPCLIESIGPDQ